MLDLTRLGYLKDKLHKHGFFRKMLAGQSHSAAASSEALEGSILDQNQCGSCTGHGTSQWMQVTYAKAGNPLPFRPSPKGVYAVTRCLDRAAATPVGTPLPALTDSGAEPSDVIVALAQFGILALKMPSPQGYQSDVDPSNVSWEPQLGDLEKAATEMLQAAVRIDPSDPAWQDNLAAAIEQTGAAGIGIFVDTKNFMQYSPATGPVQTIDQGDPQGGGHWLAVTSFRTALANTDDVVKFGVPVGTLIFRGPNSWGPGWGDAGHWEVTGPCLAQVCSDAYALYLSLTKKAA